ncbi:MAG: response regulator [Hoeflea sp.]
MEITPKILVVEDNREMRELVSRALRKEGYRVSLAEDGKEMNQAIENERVDLIILDLMLPGDDGLTLCRNLRAKATTPVIIVSAKGEEMDRVLGLKMGADDYLAKPFSTLELIARVQAVLRRIEREPTSPPNEPSKIYKFNGWRLDVERRELIAVDNVIVPLSTGEFSLLQVLVQRPNRVLSREQLLDLARGRDSVAFDRSIDTQVSRLRRKIEHDPKNPTIIKTVWGGGYVLSADVTRE